MTKQPFHLAFPVADLKKANHFYAEILGCQIGRTSETWIDFDFFGNQITAHQTTAPSATQCNAVEKLQVPVPHFGAILTWEHFHELAGRLADHQVTFIHQPQIRFAGLPGEQATMFVTDGNDNVLEFKSFRDMNQVFATGA